MRRVLPLLVLLLACSDPQEPSNGEPETEPVPAEIVAWLQDNVVAFATADLAERPDDFSDLMPLTQMVGDARVVALGEATHGTREFFQMKHRILAFLVEELDFNIFAIEATWPESYRVDEYVHTGQGDPEVLLSGLYFWTWNTQEVLDMIEWMRQHNENPGGAPTVAFFGFDMQHPGMAIHNVLVFLEAVDAPAAAVAADRYSCLQPFANDWQGRFAGSYGDTTAAYQDACRGDLDYVYDLLAQNREAYEAASSMEQYARALRGARLVVQYEDVAADRTHAGRDRYMAENASWLLEQAGPDAKIVLWAHNAHVNDRGAQMGSHLRAAHGDDVVLIGFDFYRGSFNAVTWLPSGAYGELTSFTVGAPPAWSYEHYFASTGYPRMFLDLRDIDLNSPATSWLSGPRQMRAIGSVYAPSDPGRFFYDADLPSDFDIIIYFEDTNPSQLLPTQFPDGW